ncbi:MAG: glutamate synthase central domain-containing protein, partial [Candidatus Omnitrophota bacterium]
MNTKQNGIPAQQGLYDPRFEHDACGVGFICNYKGKKSNAVVIQALEALRRLGHRGATGADPKTGDGAGILIQMPHDFFAQEALKLKIDLPLAGHYASGLIFLPTNGKDRSLCKRIFEKIIKEEGAVLLGWRRVPVDDRGIGHTAKAAQPVIEQLFIAEGSSVSSKKKAEIIIDNLTFERRLYIIRKRVENAVRASELTQNKFFYITNLSSRTFSYKGLLMPDQVQDYFVDLKSPVIQSAICLVHSRYSTNTFPTWDLAQPFRYLAHNGEINTVRGNINWMRARESLLQSNLFGPDLKRILPVIVPGGSDSATIDNVFELLYLSGRPLAQVMMMLLPAAWEQSKFMGDKLKSFYEYNACLMEPWDGPAAITFTDGTRVGAVLDRNGLRPCRYLITKDDTVIMASEVGVLDIPADQILSSGRLEPGKIFFVNTEVGRIIDDRELKEIISGRHQYHAWVYENMRELDDLPYAASKPALKDVMSQMKAFGYTREDLKVIIKPMAETGQEPVGSMGNDTPHAVLSQSPQNLFCYFKQLFAQVTNPPIDPIREELVMSLSTYLGREGNLLEETPQQCNRLYVRQPVLTNEELEKIRNIGLDSFRAKTISLLFNADNPGAFEKALARICHEAAAAIKQGYSFIILSDRGVNAACAALPSLVACGAVHHFLIAKSLRTQISIVLETAEPREVHHFALLFGYGADCVNPYLAYEAVEYILKAESVKMELSTAVTHYISAIDKGLLKILSKMGISTLQSYRGAQIFEALGLDAGVVDRCFRGTVSRIGGANMRTIEKETLVRHAAVFAPRQLDREYLASGGLYQWKRDGEFHLWNPDSIAALQDAVRSNDAKKYEEFSGLINDQSGHPATLRSLFKFKKVLTSVDIAQV